MHFLKIWQYGLYTQFLLYELYSKKIREETLVNRKIFAEDLRMGIACYLLVRISLQKSNADDIQNIIDKYPYTAQVINDKGTLFVVKNENEEIIGFLWSFCRDIPAPIGNVKEEFINAVEVFDSNERCKGIGSILV